MSKNLLSFGSHVINLSFSFYSLEVVVVVAEVVVVVVVEVVKVDVVVADMKVSKNIKVSNFQSGYPSLSRSCLCGGWCFILIGKEYAITLRTHKPP